MSTTTVAFLGPNGPQVISPAQPLARADDLGLARGDGAFETMHVRGGSAWLLDAHLDRFASSLTRLQIPVPARGQLERVVAAAISEWERQHEGVAPEAGVKLVCSRGPEFVEDAAPTVYAMVFPIPEAMIHARRNGVRLAALDWGFSADVRAQAPWLLGGVKSLSYAQNMAALREARRRGGDDVLLVSNDGIVLEGPTAGVIWQLGDQLCSTPMDTGILASTTVAFLLDRAEKIGLSGDYRRLKLADLSTVDGLWLCSSVRGVVPVTAIILDDSTIGLPTSPQTEALRDLVAF